MDEFKRKTSFQVFLTLFPETEDKKGTVLLNLYPYDEDSTRESLVRGFSALAGRLPPGDEMAQIPADAQIIWSGLDNPTLDEAKTALVQTWHVLQEIRQQRKEVLDICLRELRVNGWDDAVIAMFVDAFRRMWPSNARLIADQRVRVVTGPESSRPWVLSDDMRQIWRNDPRFQSTGGFPSAFSVPKAFGRVSAASQTQRMCSIS